MSSNSISETEAETTLDLDVLRMYLRWRGITLASILSAPESAQQPQRVGDTNDPTDGRSEVDDDLRWGEIEEIEDGDTDGQGEYNCNDRWAVDRFFDDVDQPVYRTSPEQLRSGLDFLTDSSRNSVWVSPGVPFFVPMCFGVILTFSHGNLIFELVRYLFS